MVKRVMLDFISFKGTWPDLHFHCFERVPPAMPGVPHYPVVSHCTVRSFIVKSIQIGRVTPRGRTVEELQANSMQGIY